MSENLEAEKPNELLRRRMERVTESKVDSGVLGLLSTLGTTHGTAEGALGGLKDFRVRQQLQHNFEVLAGLGQLDEHMVALEAEVEVLVRACADLQAALRGPRDADGVVREVVALRAQEHAWSQRHAAWGEFHEQYLLSDDAKAVLLAPPGSEPSAALFDALSRVHEALGRWHELVGSAVSSKLCLDVIEELSGLQRAGLDRLCRWLKTRFEELERRSSSDLELDPLLLQVVAVLRLRQPALLRYCLDALVLTLRRVEHAAFQAALARFAASAVHRSSFAGQAAEPSRYLSDLMSWVHQNAAEIYELFDAMLSGGETAAGNPAVLLQSASQYADSVFQPIAESLKGRCLQLLHGEQSVATMSRLVSIQQFYSTKLARYYAAGGAMMTALAAIRLQTLDAFRSLLNVRQPGHGSGVATSMSVLPPSGDLGAPHEVYEGVVQLRELLAVLASSLVDAPAGSEYAKAVQDILGLMVGGLVGLANESAARLRRPSDVSLHLINCLVPILAALDEHPAFRARADSLRIHRDTLLDSWVDEEGAYLLQHCGLAKLLDATPDPKAAAERGRTVLPQGSPGWTGFVLPNLEERTLVQSLRAFERSLVDLDGWLASRTAAIQDDAVRAQARDRLVRLILTVYSQIYLVVSDPSSGFDAASVLHYKPSQVVLLLGGNPHSLGDFFPS